MHFDEILRVIGGFGKFQKLLYVWICLPQVFLAFHMLISIFTGAVPPHWCRSAGPSDGPPAVSNSSMTMSPSSWPEVTCPIPFNQTSAEASGDGGPPDSCPGGWQYSTETFHSTTVTEWNLVCDRATLNYVGSSIYMLGLLVGAALFGSLADKYGRRNIILLSLAMQAVFGVAAAFAPNFQLYTGLRFMVGSSVSGVIINAFVLGTEWTGSKQRMLAGIITDYSFGLGYVLLAGLAYLIRDWRSLQLAVSAPGFLFVCYIWVLPKSARWLMANNRTEEAWDLIRKAALMNGKPFTLHSDIAQQLHQREGKKKHSLVELFQTPRMRQQSLIVFYLWFVNILVYYGLSLNISDFGMNIYLTQMIFGLVEMPARTITLFTLNRSRKHSQLAFLLVGGSGCLLTIAVPSNLSIIRTVLAMIGKFGVTASLSIIYVYSAELFPTVIRQNGIGIGSMFARFGGVLAPMMFLLKELSPHAPMLLCGVLPLLGAGLTLLLPETANKPLPDTIEDIEGSPVREGDGMERISRSRHSSSSPS